MSDQSAIEKGLSKVFQLFSDVREGESLATLLLLLNLFLILVAYYIIKTVREPLILAGGEQAAELKSYAAGFQAAVLVVYVPIYGWFSSKVGRLKLIFGLTVFFIACIEIFYLMASAEVLQNYIGFIFYVWVGIFSLSVIAQFWSYANDMVLKSIGDRLFPVVAIGATVGSPVGSAVAGWLYDAKIMGSYELMQISAGILLLTMGVYVLADRKLEQLPEKPKTSVDEKLSSGGGFKLVLTNKYLLLIAVLLILLNLVNTTGEYILSKAVTAAAADAFSADPTLDKGAFIGAFYGKFFSVVNVVAVVIQAFIVSRLVKYLGMKGVLFALPIVSFGAYGLVAAGVGLGVLRWAKTAENATDYSVMNTAKALLWLPTSREEKYKAKQAIDTFFVRLGDVISALLIFVGTAQLALKPQAFAMFNLVVIVAWMGVAWLLVKEYNKLVDTDSADEAV